jgi:hypothetical protein
MSLLLTRASSLMRCFRDCDGSGNPYFLTIQAIALAQKHIGFSWFMLADLCNFSAS